MEFYDSTLVLLAIGADSILTQSTIIPCDSQVFTVLFSLVASLSTSSWREKFKLASIEHAIVNT